MREVERFREINLVLDMDSIVDFLDEGWDGS